MSKAKEYDSSKIWAFVMFAILQPYLINIFENWETIGSFWHGVLITLAALMFFSMLAIAQIKDD